MSSSDPLGYDAVMFVSFGGPEGPDDVLPFMENVTRGRGISRERLIEVSQHYQLFGGVSPINSQNRALIAAVEKRLTERGTPLRVYWGNRNWRPFLSDTVEAMGADGIQRAIAFVTSAFSSASGCRQYREDIERARAATSRSATGLGEPPIVDKIRVFYNHPGFIEPMIDNVAEALSTLPQATSIAFTAHSIPMSMASTSDYEVQLRESCGLVAEGLNSRFDSNLPWELVFQSRSGPPGQAWLEPDINDHLRTKANEGSTGVLIVPIGFISDHMEVVYDLDTQALATARSLGLAAVRASTVGTDPRFVEMICALIDERQAVIRAETPARACLGDRGPSHDICALDCCPLPTVRPQTAATPT